MHSPHLRSKLRFTVYKTIRRVFTISCRAADGHKLDSAAVDSVIQCILEVRQMLAVSGFQCNAAVDITFFSN